MRLGRVLQVVALITSSTQLGCSFLLVNGPPSADETVVVALDGSPCTTRNMFPVMDVVLATGAGGLFVIGGIGTPPLNETATQRQDREHREKIVMVSALVVGGVMTASAIWGFHTTHKCRQYIDATMEKKPPLGESGTPSTDRSELSLR